MNRELRLSLVACSLVCCGYGVHEERSFEVHGPFQRADAKIFGWSSLAGVAQEVTITLEPGVELTHVIDMSMFGPFSPGMTLEAEQQLPQLVYSQRVDEFGETWRTYSLPNSSVELGCQYGSSGDLTTLFCNWQLAAIPKASAKQLLLDQQLDMLLEQLVAWRERVHYRVIRLSTADGQQLEFYTEGPLGTRAYWSDRSKVSRRDGPPPNRSRRDT